MDCTYPKEAISISDLRPISLLEVLRKTQLSLVKDRIDRILEAHPLLLDSQHCGLSGRSCETALLRTINTLEEAEEKKLQLHVLQVDYKRAFDSVSYPVRMIGLLRIGIPPPLARYLVNLDEGARTVVRTPYAKARIEKNPRSISTLSFCQQRGTGQGDTLSSLNFSTVLDILMTLIRESVQDDIRTRVDSVNIEPVGDLGYADDWLLMATTMAKLQDKAFMASAGAAMLGLTTSPKSEAFMLDYSHSIKEPMEPLQMWDHNWDQFELPFVDKESFKYLGAIIQRSGTSKAQHKALLPPLRSLSRYICSRRASPESMLIALKSALVPKILYPLKFTCESSVVLKDISKILCSAYRKVSRNMMSFPTSLLLLPRRLGGLGFPDIELLVFQAKLSMFYRMRTRKDSAAIASALFYRRARSIGWDPVPGQYFAFPEDELIGPDCWMDTLIRFTRHSHSSITIGGSGKCSI